jgi:hypothetical protein
MAKKRSKLGDIIRLSHAGRAAAQLPRERKRRELVGNKGVNEQNARRVKLGEASGPDKDKKIAADAVRRVGEYRKGKVKGMAAGGKTKCGIGGYYRNKG